MASQSSTLHQTLTILISLYLLFISLSTPSLSSSTTTTPPPPQPSPPSVYEILPKYGLPSGLLPDSVVNYQLFEDGRFIVELKKECYVQFEYLVYYEKAITGKLSYGSITELKGIQVQRFFLWFDVDEIKVDLPPSDSIYFQVGFVNKRLDLEQFKTVHSCRDGVRFCGGSCNNGALDQFLQLQQSADEADIQMLITI